MRDIVYFDTTLRDGEQAAGYALPHSARLALAEKLASCGVDVIEAGFPLSSLAERRSCAEIAAMLAGTPTVLALMTRARAEDIRDTAKLFKRADSLLHISFPVSSALIAGKLGLRPGELLKQTAALVGCAAGLTPMIECGAEDATRSDFDFLCDYCECAIAAGARVINIADTLGLAVPEEIAALVTGLVTRVAGFADGSARLSIHCHNDRGLALANTLTAIRCGASQFEATLGGFGERAGNAAAETVLVNLAEHPELYRGRAGASLPRLLDCALDCCRWSGAPPPPGQPLLGNRIRAHASGIHQDGLRKSRGTYGGGPTAAATPERIVLSRHSGRSGVLLLAESCGLRCDDRLAAPILAELKNRNLPTCDFTEFLRLYCAASESRRHLDPFYQLDAVHGSFADNHHCVTLRLSDGKSFVGKGTDAFAAVLDAVVRLSGCAIAVRRCEANTMDGVSRCYLEAAVASGPPFAVECTGGEPVRLFARALLDAVNFHLVKTHCR